MKYILELEDEPNKEYFGEGNYYRCKQIPYWSISESMRNRLEPYDEADRKTEPTISKMEQVDKDINVRSKTENSSEKPNNCECEPRKEQNFCGKCRYLYRDFKYGLSCYRLMDNEPCKYEERKDEPTISKMEQVDKDINVRSKERSE